MKQFLLDMFTGSDTSIKRIIAFLGFLFISTTMVINSFTHESMQPADNLVDAVTNIVLVCIAGNVAEKFLMKLSGKSAVKK